MRKSTRTRNLPSSSSTASLRIVMGLALAASASVLWWNGGAKGFSFALETSSTLESRVAALDVRTQ